MFYSNVENFKSATGYEIDGVWYRYIQYIKTASCAQYDLLKWSDRAAGTVTLGATAADEKENAAGIATVALALNDFGFAAFAGPYYAKTKTSGSTTDGIQIMSQDKNGGITKVPATATSAAIAYLNAKAIIGIARETNTANSTITVELAIP